MKAVSKNNTAWNGYGVMVPVFIMSDRTKHGVEHPHFHVEGGLGEVPLNVVRLLLLVVIHHK